MAKLATSFKHFNLLLALWAGLMMAIGFGFFIFAMPGHVLEQLVAVSGLQNVVSAAQPPLGATARGLIALAGSLGVGVLVSLGFILADRPWIRARTGSPRQPLSARDDLGFWPVIEDSVGRGAPPAVAYASSPVSASPEPLYFDLAAVKAAALRDAEQDTSDALDLGQWPQIEMPEAFEEPAAPSAQQDDQAGVESVGEGESIDALMRRLEAGIARRGEAGITVTAPSVATRSGAGLRATLDELRTLASR